MTIRQILEQISTLEDELQKAVEENHLRYTIEDKRIVFEQAVKASHQRVKLGLFRWFAIVRPQNFLTAPIIYGMIVPLALFDLCVTFYQLTCFPIYGRFQAPSAKSAA